MTPASTKATNLDTRAIWAIAIPAMLTNVATALIGIGDIWIVGQLQDAATQGAVDVGSRLFIILFVTMNFLKTGTTGLVAQAGTRDGEAAQTQLLARGLVIGAAIAGILLLAKPWLMPALLAALGAEAGVLSAATIYAEIRYWAAPGVMLNLALIGFLVGRRQMAAVLAVEVIYNLLNVTLGVFLALQLDWGIAGIGWSSFIAEYVKLAILAALIMRTSAARALFVSLANATVFGWSSLKPFLSVNRDLFLRTVVLIGTGAVLTRVSAERGEIVLAANGIIYQLFAFTALLIDGFENAAQVLNGERLGAKDRTGFVAYIRSIMQRALAVALIVSIALLVLADPLLAEFAATPEVAAEAQKLKWWLAALPLAGAAGFVLDGVFVGASWTRSLLLTMLGAAAVYFLSLWLSWPLGNWAAWASVALFLIVRTGLQLLVLPRELNRTFKI